MKKISLIALVLVSAFSSVSTFAETKGPLPKGDEWCTGSSLVNVKFAGEKPEYDVYSSRGWYLCIYFDESGRAAISHDPNSRFYRWDGSFGGSSEASIGSFETEPVLLEQKVLKTGEIALLYRLKPSAKGNQLVLSYRAAVGLIYNPKTDSFADYATFLVDDEDHYVYNTEFPQAGFYRPRYGADNSRSEREFSTHRSVVYRLLKEISRKRNH